MKGKWWVLLLGSPLVLVPVVFLLAMTLVFGLISSIGSGIGGMAGGLIGSNSSKNKQQTNCPPLDAGGPGKSTPVGQDQIANVRSIIGIGKTRNLPPDAWVLAVMTAEQESGVRNLTGGDRDSVGMFQQRPSAGWGQPTQLQRPEYSAMAFFGGSDVPPSNTGLLDHPQWQQQLTEAGGNARKMSQLAQSVQRSALPMAYAKWYPQASSLVQQHQDAPAIPLPAQPTAPSPGTPNTAQQVSTSNCGSGGGGSGMTAQGNAKDVITAASSQQNTMYAWGGGGANGPSMGKGPDAGVVGFDCSSLVQYAFKKGANVDLPRNSKAQYNATAKQPVQPGQWQPGDLLFWGSSPGAIHHVAIYVGDGTMIEAPFSGQKVRTTPVRAGGDYLGATRIPGLNDAPPAA